MIKLFFSYLIYESKFKEGFKIVGLGHRKKGMSEEIIAFYGLLLIILKSFTPGHKGKH